MTGMAALAICAAFTSCSKDTNVYNPDQPKEDIKLSYDQAFVKVFGQPAYDQDWGFGTASKARTRTTINVNGNEEKYEAAPALKDNEETQIRDYVRQLGAIPQVLPTGLKNYFVTQVHDGEETYTNGDGVGGILGSSKMNNLQIAMETGGVINGDGSLSSVGNWMHINNFNKGDNTDWNGNTLVEDGGTFNFAYHGTEDNRYHDRWISVKGEDVDAYYNALGTYSGAKYAGYYYICFDFEGTYAEGYTQIQGEWYNPDSPNDNKWGNNFNNINLPGDWTNADWSTCDLTIDWKYYDNNGAEQTITLHLNDANQVRNIQTSNYVGGNMVIEGNNKYDDWIVRLVEATPKNTDPDDPDDPDPEYSIRVIGEDLTFGQDLDTDFDFNDVVFDVALNVPGKTFIRIKAAGGTLPLIIGVANPQNDQDYNDYEVHHLLGFTSTNVMINTNATAKGLNGATAEDYILELDTEYASAKNIPVYVKKNGVWCELTANQGEPASKIGISNLNFRWCDEQVSMKNDYPRFTEWVEATAEFRSQITWW